MISALFEPDADVKIEVSMGHQAQNFTVSNTTSVMELKVQICVLMRCGAAPEKLEVRLGDVTLEDPMPLHFYGIQDGSKLNVIKPYIRVTVLNNHGKLIYWRLNRKDIIKEVKVKLAASLNNVTTEQMHLYLVSDGQDFNELHDDDETVERCKIQDGDKLYLLIYRWTKKMNVTLKMAGMKLWGLEKDDTALGIKLKAQDQTGMPVSSMKLVGLFQYEWRRNIGNPGDHYTYPFEQNYQQLMELGDDAIPFNGKEPMSFVTEEELKADAARVEAEKKEWLKEIPKKWQEIKTAEEQRKAAEEMRRFLEEMKK